MAKTKKPRSYIQVLVDDFLFRQVKCLDIWMIADFCPYGNLLERQK